MVSFLTDTVVCGFSLYHILAFFLIYSCMGWCLEVIYAAATTGKLVSTKKTATTEIGNNRACNVSGQVLDSTGIPVPMGLGVTLKFSK